MVVSRRALKYFVALKSACLSPGPEIQYSRLSTLHYYKIKTFSLDFIKFIYFWIQIVVVVEKQKICICTMCILVHVYYVHCT